MAMTRRALIAMVLGATAVLGAGCSDVPPRPDTLKVDALKADALRPDAAPTCGNNKLDTGEECDKMNLDGKTCSTFGFTGTGLACKSDCSFDKSACCGDGTIGGTEECDGSQLGGKNCVALGCLGGQLGCDSSCTFEKIKCTVCSCGDGVIDVGEECDKTNLNGKTCSTFGFTGTGLACRLDCTFDKSGCCGDGTIGKGEGCDGAALGGKDCIALGCLGGQLGCDSSCTFDKSECTLCSCGNSVVDVGEGCDRTNLAGKSCTSFGFTGTGLACKADCSFDKSACCGDGTVGGTEECDKTDLDSKTCSSFGFTGIGLVCKADCAFDKSACCGDGTIGFGEDCDGSQLDGKTCATQGFVGGTLACRADCAFDVKGCHNCGNGALDPGEQCDGSQHGGKTCQTQGFEGGTLGCTSACTFDVIGCYKCGDGVKNGPTEQCDGSDFGGKTCSTLGFAGGTPKCTGTCRLSGCSTSGYVSIAPGTFTMGSPPGEPCSSGGQTQHQVTLTHSFEVQGTETTQGQFQAAMGYNPATFGSCGATCPIENVNWHQAAAHCNTLSAQKALTPCYTCSGSGPSVTCQEAAAYSGANIYTCTGYRLPTEAEWEYSYRAGTTTALYNGPRDPAACFCTPVDANVDKIGWYCGNSAVTYPGCTPISGAAPCAGTHPAGQKLANGWGLHDMAGNVWEWGHDWHQFDLGSAAVTDPWGAATGSQRVVRGGCSFHGFGMEAATRNKISPSHGDFAIGFRPVRTN
jgi:formylglycine-generating enzyme required for sulfatase activity